MCNLYTMKLSRDEVRGLLEHYQLANREWAKLFEKEQRGINDDGRIYPKYAAPVVTVQKGEERLEKMKWGMPGPVFPGKDGKIGRPSFITNVRNTESRHWTSWLAGTEVTVGKDKNAGGRCIVPASAFAEPDQNTTRPVINRWFKRADGLPFFFAGIWREWTGDHGTIKAPDVGKHRLFSFLTTDASADVKPIHSKASPVLLRSAADIKTWLHGTAADALKLQKPAPKGALVVLPDKKKPG